MGDFNDGLALPNGRRRMACGIRFRLCRSVSLLFSKDQRVSHTAIVENKRLGHALALVKAQQDLKQTTKVMTSSEKNGYRKRPRKVYGSAELLNSQPAQS
jgi:hypothetical protein